jgi:hypothetical protein
MFMQGDYQGVERSRETQCSRRQVTLAALCALMIASVASGTPPTFTVDWRAPALSVTAEKADIVSVLEVVRAKTGLEIEGFERLQALPVARRMISVTFENLSLADALRRLLSGFSYGVVGYFEPKPGTPGVVLSISSEPSAPRHLDDEARGEPQRTRGASVRIRAEDELGSSIALPAAPEQSEASRPHVRADERKANGIADPPDEGTVAGQPGGTPAVTVRSEDESGAVTSVQAPEQQRAISPARMLPDERTANENAERESARPETPKGARSASPPR